MRAIGISTLLVLAALAAASETRAERPAAPATEAARALLLDVARAGPRLVAVGGWGNVVLSDDEGVSWRQARRVPVRRTLTSVHFVDAERGWAVGHDAVVLHSRDGGESWEIQEHAPELDAPLLAVWFRDPRRGLAVGGFGLLLETRDGGLSWERRRLRDPEGEEPHLNHVFPASDGGLFIAAEFGSVFRSRDDGASWTHFQLPYEGSFWSGLGLPDGTSVLLLGMRGHAFLSEDLGDSWREIETGGDQSLQGITRLRDGRLVAVGLGGSVLTSRDDGRSFQTELRSDRSGLAAVAQTADGALLLVGEKGVSRVPAPD